MNGHRDGGRDGQIDDRSFVAAQDFILGVKQYWTTEIYPELKADYDRRAGRMGTPPETVADVAALVGGTTLYRYYAWLERHLQRFKYAGRYGLHPYHAERRDALTAKLTVPPGEGLLDLDPDFNQPAYYTGVDIHQHPGGVWSDEVAGFVYERGARTTTPLMGGKHRDLHQRFTDLIAEGGKPAALLDMGCGFGKSTRPFYETFPDARVEAVDLAEPCLRLAAQDAVGAQARNARFRQMSACETDYDTDSFDVVTSTMLVHELPPKEIGRLFDECARVLKPGGRMVHLDFYRLPTPLERFIHYTHARRNNEPYMEPWAELDVVAELESRGFRNVAVLPFKEADAAVVDNSPIWRFPWTVIAAER